MLKLLKSGKKGEKHHYWYYRDKKIIREYCEHLYANKLYNLDDINNFLEKEYQNGLKEIENLNRPISSEGMQSVIKNPQQRKAQN